MAVRNEEHAKRLKDFSSMRFGSCQPSDLDAYLEFGNEAFVFVELKYGDAPLEGGQKLAFERLADIVGREKKSLLIWATHKTPDGQQIDVGAGKVRKYRSRGRWLEPDRDVTVRGLVEMFREHCKGEGQ